VTTWVETAVQCRPLLAVRLGCTSHLVQKHFRPSKVILLMNFSLIIQFVLLVDVKVGDRDPFAQLLQKLRTRQSLSFMTVVSSTWFCYSQLVKDVIESSWAAAAACSLSSWCYPKCHCRKTHWIGNVIDVIGCNLESLVFFFFLIFCIQLTSLKFD
jgi:hypothetical protein